MPSKKQPWKTGYFNRNHATSTLIQVLFGIDLHKVCAEFSALEQLQYPQGDKAYREHTRYEIDILVRAAIDLVLNLPWKERIVLSDRTCYTEPDADFVHIHGTWELTTPRRNVVELRTKYFVLTYTKRPGASDLKFSAVFRRDFSAYHHTSSLPPVGAEIQRLHAAIRPEGRR